MTAARGRKEEEGSPHCSEEVQGRYVESEVFSCEIGKAGDGLSVTEQV